MELVTLQSRLLSEVAKDALKSRNRFTHFLISWASRIGGKTPLSFSQYGAVLECFASGTNRIEMPLKYQVAISELRAAGFALGVTKSAFDALLSLGGSSTEELNRFGAAMGISDNAAELFKSMSQADLLKLMANRLELARKQETAI